MTTNGKTPEIQIQVTDLNAKEVMRKVVQSGQEDGFFVCDLSDVIEKYQKWERAMPRVKPFYAVKVNDIRVVIETLAALGTGFDCASVGEIMKILSLGVSPDRIIFANPAKTTSQIKYACKVGVLMMTFDSEDELYKIKKLHPSAELVLRIKYDDPSALYVLGKKFGADPQSESEKLLMLAHSLNLKVIGVAFHIGSLCKDYSIYRAAIASAKSVFDMGSKLGYKFRLLDIGGGFPGNRDDVIFKIGSVINEALEKHFQDGEVEIISEPGRYFVDSAFSIATCIHTTKTLNEPEPNCKEKTKTKIYYTNISIYQALLPIAFNEVYPPRLLFDRPLSPEYPSLIWGSTCDACDKLSDLVQLPELSCGEWLYFETVGAYTITLGCEFNGYPICAVHSILKHKDWLLLNKKDANIPKGRYVHTDDPKYFITNLFNPYIVHNKFF